MRKRSLVLLTLAALAGCTASSGYENVDTDTRTPPPSPIYEPSPTTTYSPYAPATQKSYNQSYLLPYTDSYSPAYRPTPAVPGTGSEPNIYYNSPLYWNDPNLPVNRGRWVNVPGPGGQNQTVWTTEPDRFRVGPLPQDYPTYRGGYIQPDKRWDPQYRR